MQLTASANKQQMRRVSCVVWVNIQVAVSYSAVVMTRSNASKTRELTTLVINSGNSWLLVFSEISSESNQWPFGWCYGSYSLPSLGI